MRRHWAVFCGGPMDGERHAVNGHDNVVRVPEDCRKTAEEFMAEFDPYAEPDWNATIKIINYVREPHTERYLENGDVEWRFVAENT